MLLNDTLSTMTTTTIMIIGQMPKCQYTILSNIFSEANFSTIKYLTLIEKTSWFYCFVCEQLVHRFTELVRQCNKYPIKISRNAHFPFVSWFFRGCCQPQKVGVCRSKYIDRSWTHWTYERCWCVHVESTLWICHTNGQVTHPWA